MAILCGRAPFALNNHAANLRLLRQIYCRSAYNQITRLKIIHSNPTLSLQNKAMAGTKRKNGHESSNEVYSNKSRAKPTVEARVDPTYGQRSALPGLDDDANIEGYDDDLNYDDQDALNYLRTVRQEASGIPNLLVAPKDMHISSRAMYEDGVGDHRGWYEDGAYCAAPQENSQTSSDAVAVDEEDKVGKDPQLAYFDSILARYEALREQLQQTPPPEAVKKLDKDHPTYLGRLNTEVARWWRWKMRIVDPVPAQIASMDKGTVLRLLGLLTTGTLLKRGAEVQVGVSRWAWGLLARLPDRGQLSSEEIGAVRELGKKAVLVGMGLREEQRWEEGMDEVEAAFEEDYEADTAVVNDEEIDLDMDNGFDDSELDANTSRSEMINNISNEGQKIGPQWPKEGGSGFEEKNADEHKLDMSDGKNAGNEDDGELPSEDLAAAKARILQALKNAKAEEIIQEAEVFDEEVALAARKTAAKWNTKATVDMIITVAGEVYGQRDLLEFRQAWGITE